MDMESIRELFSTASIVIGENGVSIQYPPRNCSVYRNCSIISEPVGPAILADMIAASKKFSIYIGADGLRFDCSTDGNDIEERTKMSPVSNGITYEQARKEYMESRDPDDGSYFMSFFEGADLSNERDVFARFIAFLDDVESRDATNLSDLDDFRRWKEIKRLSNEIAPAFRGFEFEICDGLTEFSAAQIKDSITVSFEGKDKKIIENLFRVSSTTKDYSCVFGNSFLSLQFCID